MNPLNDKSAIHWAHRRLNEFGAFNSAEGKEMGERLMAIADAMVDPQRPAGVTVVQPQQEAELDAEIDKAWQQWSVAGNVMYRQGFINAVNSLARDADGVKEAQPQPVAWRFKLCGDGDWHVDEERPTHPERLFFVEPLFTNGVTGCVKPEVATAKLKNPDGIHPADPHGPWPPDRTVVVEDRRNAGVTVGVQPGLKLVPVEPTQEMVDAGDAEAPEPWRSGFAREMWKAMLDAAPKDGVRVVDRVQRLMDACEGEAGGLALTRAAARRILAFVDGGTPALIAEAAKLGEEAAAGVGVLPGQPKRVGWFVFIDGEWKQSTKYAESALPLYELPDGVTGSTGREEEQRK